MKAEADTFKNAIPDFEKMGKYGFKLRGGNYFFEKPLTGGSFKAVIEITPDGKVSGSIFDIESGDEFLPFRILGQEGGFAGEVRLEYKEILSAIKDKCFTKKYFVYPQSNRITEKIIEKYGDMPEFLWEKFKGSGIFRNPNSKKWYAAILDTSIEKFYPDKSGTVEVINLKLLPAKIQELLKQKGFYPAYHMNKKHWISIILDETVADKEIERLIEISRNHTI